MICLKQTYKIIYCENALLINSDAKLMHDAIFLCTWPVCVCLG